jgi:hypothetical protein
MFVGLGGAHLSLAYTPGWTEGMTAGRGWIAIALVIFATWDPLRAVIGAVLFGGISAVPYAGCGYEHPSCFPGDAALCLDHSGAGGHHLVGSLQQTGGGAGCLRPTVCARGEGLSLHAGFRTR